MATFTVTSTSDTGAGSLRQAILDANGNGQANSINFDAGLAGQTITLTSGELSLTSDITIDGDTSGDGHADITLSGNDNSRIFRITGVDVELRSLTLTDGRESAGGAGAAAFIDASATVLVYNSTISNNDSSSGGGGFYVRDSVLEVVNSTISNNVASDVGSNGGGIFNTGNGALNITNSTVANNSAQNFGGGIFNQGTLIITSSTIVGNDSLNGGGLHADGTETIINSVIAGNTQNGNTANDVIGTIETATNSFFGTTATITNSTNNINTGGDPLLGQLQDHGGPVQTMAILTNSPLINGGDATLLPADTFDLDGDTNTTEALPVDANGAARVGDQLDIGAVEFNAATALTPNPVGNEIRVNTQTNEVQEYSSVAALSGGGFVVTWASFLQDGNGFGIYGQRYDANGVAVGDEFHASTYTSGHQYYSSVTGLADGGFVVTWASDGQDGSSYGIYGQRYDADGVEAGGEFHVSTYTDDQQRYPSITGLLDGGFVVTWQSLGQDGSDWGVYGQHYDLNGASVGGEFQVNTHETGFQVLAVATALADGGFLITWGSQNQAGDGDGYGVFGQRYGANGAKVGDEFQINTYTVSNQNYSSAIGLSDGGFVVTWSSWQQDGDNWGIIGQRYGADGVAIDGEFQVNTQTTNEQIYSSVVALPDGGFVATWKSLDQDGSDYGIYGQRYDADGVAVGSEFPINQTTDGRQGNDTYYGSETIATLTNGQLVVTWDGNVPGDDQGIAVRLVDVPASNSAPVVSAPAMTVSEGGVVAITAALLSISDANDANGDVTVTVSNVTNGQFESSAAPGTAITSFTLEEVANGVISFVHDGGEDAPTFSVQASDDEPSSSGAPVDAIISFTNVNSDPQIADGQSFEAAENQSAVGTVVASDVDGDDVLTYSLTSGGGNDNALFAIDGATGDLTFLAPPDFEAPGDADEDNDYVVEVQVDDGHGGTATKTVSVIVSDVNEAPEIADGQSFEAAENQSAVGTVVASDVDGDDVLTYSLTSGGGNDNALFAIDGATGDLTFLAPPDFEAPGDADEDNDYVVEVQVDDGHGGTATKTVSVIVSDVNEAPEIADGQSFEAAENQSAVGTVVASDVDGDDVLTYSLTSGGGNDNALFAIDGATGDLTFLAPPDFEAPGDADEDNDYVVEVQVDDGHGGTATKTVSVIVSDVNEAPEIADGQSFEAAENQSAVGTVVASDVDGDDVLTYSLTSGGGNDNALFAIDGATGDLTFLAPPDFEAPGDADEDNDYVVEVQVDDGHGGTATKTVSVIVSDVNEAPEIADGQSFEAAENQSAVGTVVASDVDGDDVLTYSLTSGGGNDNALFAIDGATGDLTFLAPPDFEAPGDADEDNDYVVEVQVDDGHGGTATKTVSVIVSDVNEAPEIADGQSFEAAENQSAVGTVVASDVDGDDVLTYSLTSGGGNDNALFAIDGATGDLTFLAPPDFEAPGDADEDNDYVVEVQVDDGHGGTATKTVSVIVSDVNEAPEIADGQSFEAAENQSAVGTVVASDVDGDDVLTYSLTSGGGNDNALFAIDGATGDLTFLAPPDFEAPGDADEDNDYVVEVQVDDGHGGTATKTVSVIVSDVNEAPEIADGQSFEAAENQSAVGTVVASDVDGDDVLTYSLTSGGGNDNALFAIDGATGDLTFLAPPDFEAPGDADEDNDYVVEVQVDDGHGGMATKTVSVIVSDVNEAPEIADGQSFEAAENQSAVGTVVASDVDGDDVLTYSLTSGGGNDNALFAIDGATGDLTFLVPPDFEAPGDADEDNDYVVEVQVDDGHGGTATKTVSVIVSDVNEAPEIADGQSFEAAENQSAVGTVVASDVDGDDVLTYSLTSGGGNDNALFAIDGATGDLTFLAPPDFEAPGDADEDNDYVVEVQVDDGHGGTATKTVSVIVSDVNEAPEIADGQSFEAAENQSAVGTVVASDVDGDDVLTYSLTSGGGNDNALFAIDGATGDLTFLAPPDFEAPGDADEDNDYVVEVQVDDGHGGTATKTVSVIVSDVNEAPEIADGQSFEAAENQSAVGTVVASDVDGDDVLTYSLTSGGGNDNALFAIDGATGDLTFLAPPDFEAPGDADEDNDYVVEVQVDDGHGGTATKTVSVIVSDVNEAPEIADGQSFEAAENQSAVGTVVASDVDGDDVLTYSLTSGGGNDNALFAIDGATGDLTFLAPPDFEAPGDADEDNDYVVEVQVDDGHGGTATKTVSVIVSDVNEAPMVTGSTVSTNEDVPYMIAQADLGFRDADNDALDHITITGLPAVGTLLRSGVALSINDTVTAAQIANGELVFTPDAEGNGAAYASFDFTASDGAADSAVATMTFDVTPVNDSPVVRILAKESYAAETVLTGTQLFSASDPEGESDIDHMMLFDDVISGAAIWQFDGEVITPGSAGFEFEYSDRHLLTYTVGAISNDFVFAAFDNSGVASNNAPASISGLVTSPFTENADIVDLTLAGQTWHALGGDDAVTGTSGNDIIFGEADDDVLVGGAGADRLDGGTGNDIIWGDAFDTELTGGAGDGDYLLFSDDENHDLNLGAAGFETVIANAGVDKLDASGATQFMVIWGGDSGDALTLGDGGGYIFGENGDDIITGGAGGDTLVGGAGADTMFGGGGNDVLWVDGSDTINGGESAGDSDWVLIDSAAGDSINVANKGFETAVGNAGDDTIDARGDNGGLVMWGNAGADHLYGGNGDDHYYGGGPDGEIDIFHMQADWGVDSIWDWEDGVDLIDLSGAGVTNIDQLTIAMSGAFEIISFGDDQIFVQNAAGLLDADDFTFV